MTHALFDLSGRIAVVTGGGMGLGEAIAVGLAQHGADVAIADLQPAAAERTARRIEELGRRSVAITCDVANPDDIARAFEQVDAALGPVSILVNNAGAGSHTRPEDLTLEEWHHVMDVNATGSFLCAQLAGRRMIPRRQGSIINIASIAGATSLGRGNFVYGISKGAVIQFTRDLAVEWAKHNIRVNAILPCQIRTGALQALIADPKFDSDSLVERFLVGIPMNRLGEPEDLAGPAIFLASDAAAMVTGAMLPVDGGNLALNAGGSHTW
jgi:NAD(P)-dependent dehydrogenase (short-subunit alcohol dehydrogenase family)